MSETRNDLTNAVCQNQNAQRVVTECRKMRSRAHQMGAQAASERIMLPDRSRKMTE